MTTRAPGRRTRSIEAIVFEALMVAVVGVILIDALSLRPATRLVPYVVGIPSFIGMVILLVRDLIGTEATTEASETPAAVYDPATGEHHLPDLVHAGLVELITAAEEEVRSDGVLPDTPEARRRQALLAAWALGVLIVAWFFDFLVAVPVGIFSIFLITRQNLLLNIGITAGASAFIYVLFKELLEVRF